MRAQTFILIASLAGTGVALGLAVWEDRETARVRARLVTMQEQREKLDAAGVRAARSVAGFGEKMEAVADRSPTPGASPSQSEIGRTQWAKAEASEKIGDPLVNDAALQNLYLAAERANLDILYAPLFRQLGLTRAQMETFRELVMKRHEQRMDLADIQQSRGLEPDDPALVGLQREVAEEFEARQIALLGGTGVASLLDYERKLPVRQLVNRFAGVAALAGRPITPEQADALTNALANASEPYKAGAAADPDRVDWPVALQESAQVLSEPQQLSFLNMVPRYSADGEAAMAPGVPVP